jgi:hypothetical protein
MKKGESRKGSDRAINSTGHKINMEAPNVFLQFRFVIRKILKLSFICISKRI